jgi:hypothetical protein
MSLSRIAVCCISHDVRAHRYMARNLATACNVINSCHLSFCNAAKGICFRPRCELRPRVSEMLSNTTHYQGYQCNEKNICTEATKRSPMDWLVRLTAFESCPSSIVVQCVHKVPWGFSKIVARKQIELATCGLRQIIVYLSSPSDLRKPAQSACLWRHLSLLSKIFQMMSFNN